MKTLVKSLSFLFLGITILQAQENENHDVVVNVTNLKNNTGQVLVAVFNTEDSFLNKGFKSAKVKIENNTCSVTFKNLPKGTYAISMFHDENNNNKLDTNFLGIPKEAYGCSNNAKGVFGPPKWENAKFEISNQTITQNIKL
ncbi:DUF2141 domain-containing protein [Mariniflexile jejuense]|uniref:DUF2141 domain-containing protein n=1 Tax=Mariniflexile jejuense TaxID=1173582 RepID=A0ABW3JQE0_9FLAO